MENDKNKSSIPPSTPNVDTPNPPTQEANSDNQETSLGRDQEINKKQEDTRSKVAILIILGFFAVVFVSFIIPIVLKDTSDLRELLSTIMGGLAGIVGFVVGHYFKH